jgi:hypothetical protein
MKSNKSKKKYSKKKTHSKKKINSKKKIKNKIKMGGTSNDNLLKFYIYTYPDNYNNLLNLLEINKDINLNLILNDDLETPLINLYIKAIELVRIQNYDKINNLNNIKNILLIINKLENLIIPLDKDDYVDIRGKNAEIYKQILIKELIPKIYTKEQLKGIYPYIYRF